MSAPTKFMPGVIVSVRHKVYAGGDCECPHKVYAGGDCECPHKILQKQALDSGICDRLINEEATWPCHLRVHTG